MIFQKSFHSENYAQTVSYLIWIVLLATIHSIVCCLHLPISHTIVKNHNTNLKATSTVRFLRLKKKVVYVRSSNSGSDSNLPFMVVAIKFPYLKFRAFFKFLTAVQAFIVPVFLWAISK